MPRAPEPDPRLPDLAEAWFEQAQQDVGGPFLADVFGV